MIDYYALLQKYLAHIIDREGWDFLEDHCFDGEGFTDAELAELRRMSSEVDV